MSNKSVAAAAALGQSTPGADADTAAADTVIAASESALNIQNQNGNDNNNSSSSSNHNQFDPLCGPDSVLRRAHIRQRLALQGCAAVDEMLSKKNAKMCVEDVMIVAARGNMVDVVAYCIETKGADATKLVMTKLVMIDADDSSSSDDHDDLLWKDALLAAVEEGSSQVVEYLLVKGQANANTHSHKPLGHPSVAALWAAAQHGHVYIITLLLQHGACINTCKLDTGNTALFVAAQNGHSLACSVLIQHGADLNKSHKQPDPIPPLGIAIAAARPDIMALLLNAGATLPPLCLAFWRQVLEHKESINIPDQRQLKEDVLYQIKALVEQAIECALLNHTNQEVKNHYERCRDLEYKGKYRQALRALVEAQTAYLQFNNYQEPRQLKPSPPAWVQLRLDGERLTNYVYGCKGSDGRVSKWKRHVFYKDDLQPPKLYHYTEVYYAPHQKMYRCGGMKMELMHVPTEEYPLWAFNVKLKQWALVPTTGQSPGMRARHVAALLGSYMYVFAGSTGLMHRDNKLFRLNLETKVWELIKVNRGSTTVPMSREGAAMCAYDGKLYVMGGENKGNTFADLWQFNPKNNKWKELRPAPDSPVQQPLDRHVHGMWACKNKLYVFGGQGLVPNATHPHHVEQAWSNLQCFDLQTRHWQNIPNVGDFTWNFAEFLTLPLYRGQSEPSAILLWGGYHDKTNPDPWATHQVCGGDDLAYLQAVYGDEVRDYGMPYRRRLLRFDCETHTWTNLKLLDFDIVMPTATCWGAELWDESSSQDDGLTRIMVGGGYGLTHNSQKKKEYTTEEKSTYERLGIGKLASSSRNPMSPEISEQVYQVEILDERNYCAADQALHNQGWAWKLFTTPISQQREFDGKIGFGSPNCFRHIDYCDQDFLDPPRHIPEASVAGASKWASIQDNDPSLLGRRLVLKDLQAKPELNGRVCRCGIFNAKMLRYQVFLEPKRGISGVVTMAVKSSNLEHADPLDALRFFGHGPQGKKPTPVVAAAWLSDKRYRTIDTRPHNLARFIDAETETGEPYTLHVADSYKGPFSTEGRAMLHAVGDVSPKTPFTISLCHFPKQRMKNQAKAGVAYDTFTNWVHRVHERDSERSKHFQQNIVAHRKAAGWETDETKSKWLRVDVELDGIEPAISRSIIISPLISMHRLHHQVLAPVFGRQSNIHCYAFRQCHKFSFPGQGTHGAKSSMTDQAARHLELVNANWIGPKISSALDGFFQPFYIGGEMADDQKIMLGDLFHQKDHDDTEELYIRYIHDFGDWWSHTLTVTEYSGAVPLDASVAHVLSGYGTCPPEDCGGITEYINKIRQLTGVMYVTDDFDEVEPEETIQVHPLKEMWWKCVNSMRQRTGFRASLNQPFDFDLEATRRHLEEALRQRLEKPGFESLQLVSQDFNSSLYTIPSEAGGSEPRVLKQIKNPKEMCGVCGVTAALQMCSGCGQIAYCGREHQLQHWKEHKIDCKRAQVAKKESSSSGKKK